MMAGRELMLLCGTSFFLRSLLFAECSFFVLVELTGVKTDLTMSEMLFDAPSKVCAEPGDRWVLCLHHRRKYV